jgi:hypothetical protein
MAEGHFASQIYPLAPSSGLLLAHNGAPKYYTFILVTIERVTERIRELGLRNQSETLCVD